MADSTEARLADVLAEVEKLRSDNARLRDLLGLNTRHDDGHRQALWGPETRPGMLSRRFARHDLIRRDGT